MVSIWSTMSDCLPNLETLRIHMDAQGGIDRMAGFPHYAFSGIANLPKLSSITLEVHSSRDPFALPKHDIICDRLKGFLMQEVKSNDRRIDITHELLIDPGVVEDKDLLWLWGEGFSDA